MISKFVILQRKRQKLLCKDFGDTFEHFKKNRETAINMLSKNVIIVLNTEGSYNQIAEAFEKL